ncbi:hypothetical protein O6H91_09G018700 [Diphasiastrum complanatum]|uniref:Uncharacterized protein n=2 Tax=Diphasiastrum complanatum TaxID=34168 RepID=A0ACC2CLR3_DIPCM|nr:hypothetical protein O6H91_09G018200 [Diphasiastrum complanatum]KAJ7542944.1 hypothetical protein O6H91_09G018700 [Diphasiastrum complanatum]
MPSGTLEVLLYGGFGLKNTDFFGKSDPYAVISCRRQILRSETARNQGSKPVWNQAFQFVVEEGPVTELVVKIYDEDRFTSDDFVGSIKISLEEVLTRGSVPATGYEVVLPSGKIKGVVKLALKFTPKIITGHSSGSKNSSNVSSHSFPDP